MKKFIYNTFYNYLYFTGNQKVIDMQYSRNVKIVIECY